MAESFDAVYEGGVFRPLEPVDLVDGLRVRITLSPATGPHTPEQIDAALRLGHRVYEGLTDEEIAEIEADIHYGQRPYPIPTPEKNG